MSNTLKFGNGEWYGKEGTILAYNDENNNYKPLPFTFDRDSVATRVNKQGLIETVGADQPRIDYLNDSNGALKLEPSRTNLITYSEDFSQSAWIKSNTSITSNVEISPDGTLNGSKIVGSGYLQFLINAVASNVYTFSVFWKKDTSSVIKFRISSSGQDETITLNTETLSFSNITNIDDYSVEEFGNGWYRLKITWTEQNTEVAGIRIICDESDATSSLYIYGAQVEVGSYATSYIPTQGGSAVTRLADSCNNGGNEQVINSTEGVLYFEGSALDDDGTDRKITLSDGSLNNAINFGFSRFSGNINAEVKSGGVLQTSGFGATGIAQDNNNKFALSWGGGVSKFYVNGTLASSYTSVTSPIGMNVLNFSLSSGFQKSYLNCKDIRVYNTALSDSELQALTS
jgi:hypothetical protein